MSTLASCASPRRKDASEEKGDTYVSISPSHSHSHKEPLGNTLTSSSSSSSSNSHSTGSSSSTRGVLVAFLLFGLLNNMSYVVMLSAAKDIMDGGVVSIVLLAADVPALMAQTLSPFLLSHRTYGFKVCLITFFAILSYLTVGVSPNPSLKLIGVVFASICFGLGECTFLALASSPLLGANNLDSILSAYGSGTGAAGLAGSGIYLVFTSILGWSASASLILLCCLPPWILFAYFRLVVPNLTKKTDDFEGKSSSTSDSLTSSQKMAYLPRLLPYFFPLFVVYVLTFTLNHAVLPHFRVETDQGAPLLKEMQSEGEREQERAGEVSTDDNTEEGNLYVAFFFLYQMGVFLSRSSLRYFQTSRLSLYIVVQFGLFTIFMGHAFNSSLFSLLSIPSVEVAQILVFLLGIVCGSAYINTFHSVSSHVDMKYREFAMGIVSSATTSGPIFSGLLGLYLESVLATKA